MPVPSLLARPARVLRDYVTRIYDNSADDNIFFLASGIAFDLLLAAVPFVLLLLAGLGYLLNQSATASSAELWKFIDQLLPPHAETASAPIHALINDAIRARGPTGLIGLIGFIWFSTRLFGSVRTVLADVFDIEQQRSIIVGKLFDVQITVLATLLFVAYSALSAYVRLATSQGAQLFIALGLRDELMSGVEYVVGNLLAAGLIVIMFFALYRFLPDRRIPWRAALVAALFTSVLFEVAKFAFTAYLSSFNPGSFYTGTLYAIAIIVLWVYYAGLIFILGGEVGRVYELRRMRRLQRVILEE
ncbi:MAG TPA: YihY/virulence factor BrkB family protein [Gemmatimonadaceae bacterium]|jgi:membrane protein|nr:YihY/virulence factor BrkB family protein [Gemmatimonadaceae bacterium]